MGENELQTLSGSWTEATCLQDNFKTIWWQKINTLLCKISFLGINNSRPPPRQIMDWPFPWFHSHWSFNITKIMKQTMRKTWLDSPDQMSPTLRLLIQIHNDYSQERSEQIPKWMRIQLCLLNLPGWECRNCQHADDSQVTKHSKHKTLHLSHLQWNPKTRKRIGCAFSPNEKGEKTNDKMCQKSSVHKTGSMKKRVCCDERKAYFCPRCVSIWSNINS